MLSLDILDEGGLLVSGEETVVEAIVIGGDVGVVVGEVVVLEDVIRDRLSHTGGEEGADVDEEVEDRECDVSSLRILRIVVDLTDESLEVSLEESRTYRDQE